LNHPVIPIAAHIQPALQGPSTGCHFDIVGEDEEDTAALTVRGCNGLACEMAGARDLLQRLPEILGADILVIAAPCIGACHDLAASRSWPGQMRC
jgi:hypothetical protein